MPQLQWVIVIFLENSKYYGRVRGHTVTDKGLSKISYIVHVALTFDSQDISPPSERELAHQR